MTIIQVKDINAKNRNIPDSLVPFFFLCYFLFGIDFGFGFYFNENYRKVTKYISLAISILIVFPLSLPLIKLDIGLVWVWVGICKYVALLIVLKTIKYTPCDLIIELHIPDANVRKFSFIISALYSLIMVVKHFFSIIRCFDDTKTIQKDFCQHLHIALYFLYYLANLGVDTISVALIIIFYFIHCKMECLKSNLKKSEINLHNFLKSYMKIADCYDNIKPFLNGVMVIELITGVPKFLATLWYLLYHMEQDGITWKSCGYEMLYTIHIALKLILPAFVAEVANAQVDAIRLDLSEKIPTGTDEAKISQASRTLQYLEHRRLRHEILRMIPIDIRLPIGLFGFCGTYFIVLLQFTHLYD